MTAFRPSLFSGFPDPPSPTSSSYILVRPGWGADSGYPQPRVLRGYFPLSVHSAPSCELDSLWSWSQGGGKVLPGEGVPDPGAEALRVGPLFC